MNDDTNTTVMTCRDVWEEMNDLLSKKKLIRNYCRYIQMFPNNNNNNKIKQNENSGSSNGHGSSGYTVTTDLFPLEALQVYSAYNLEEKIDPIYSKKYFSSHRGGSQGDYRYQMNQKIINVVNCLTQYPCSKRALITVPNTSCPSHTSDDDAKCMREIHFYLEQDEKDEKEEEEEEEEEEDDGSSMMCLNATVLMRAQAAEIFPKNIHFIGSLMDRIVQGLNDEKNKKNHDKDKDVDEDEDEPPEKKIKVCTEGENKNTKQIKIGTLCYLATTLISVRED